MPGSQGWPPILEESEHLILRGPPELTVCAGTLTSCGNCWEGAGILLSHGSPEASVNLESGVYALELRQAIDEPGPVGLELR